jgi:hypothetical protein
MDDTAPPLNVHSVSYFTTIERVSIMCEHFVSCVINIVLSNNSSSQDGENSYKNW